jgi:signal transduction histidine kinase
VSAGILDAKLPPPELQIPALAFRQPGFVRPDLNPGNTNLTAAAQGTNRISGTHRPGRSLANDLPYISEPQEVITEPFLPRLFVLWLLTACCYGVQVLADRQRRVLEEEREFAVREAQLQTAGRLAAEIAHQLKNPLTIINNTVFSLQRAGKEGKPPAAGPIEIIQEEIGRADRILTDLMGYAQLAEGRVEKLNVVEELDQAIDEALPTAAGYRVQVERHYDSYFPPLLMQRRHLSEILVNLLQNAREALNGAGKVSVTAVCRPDYSVEIAVADNGPGVPPDKLEQIFEAYYTTKERGTGLGLAIVKHNVELYAGTVRVESELGNGARFVLVLPAKALINVTKRK